MSGFAARLLAWHARHGRHDLPWQRDRDPYRIWLSEVMLQQTQVATVIPYFERFVARFPDIPALAAAADDEVMGLWSGLGYYARARNLLAAARRIRDAHGGQFPEDHDAISALPGVGRSTAAAIAALAWGERRAILDGNCRRVYARHAGVEGWPGARDVADRLWHIADARTPARDVAEYTQAIMDLGATLCTRTRPDCGACPVAHDCIARHTARTADLPTPRPRRVRPHRVATMLLTVAECGGVLLERRPPRGIWGGLWCPPFVDEAEVPAGAVRLPPVAHAFTHFTLEIHPALMHLAPTPARRDGHYYRRWDHLGLPAPVRRILDGLELPDVQNG